MNRWQKIAASGAILGGLAVPAGMAAAAAAPVATVVASAPTVWYHTHPVASVPGSYYYG